MADLWLIGPISSPRLQWGAVTSRSTHKCPHCGIPLLTGERPGFCCGPNGKYAASILPLPPLPYEYNELIQDRSISRDSRILNLIFSFASIETTHDFPNMGAPSFFAIQGKVYHRVRPTHQNSSLRWLLYDGFMQDRIPFPERATKLPTWWITNVKTALLRVNPFVGRLRQLSAVQLEDCPQVHLRLQDEGACSTDSSTTLPYQYTT